LATTLTGDCDLAHKLFLQQLFNTNIFNENTYKRILQGINEINGKYFVKSLDPSTFITTLHARGMLAEQALNHTNHRSPLNL
jgi:hypothetical protein